MARVTCSASVTTMLVLCILLQYQVFNAAKFIVGDDAGWNSAIQSWPTDKQFHANDTLVFKYDVGNHNVAVVDEVGYTTCTVGSEIHISGNDEIQLKQGENYFICGFPGHCAGGMKMKVTAT